jgi:hypothetical protein
VKNEGGNHERNRETYIRGSTREIYGVIMGEETKEKGEGIEGNEGKGEGTEKKPEETLIPPEWIGIPIKDYIKKGYHPYIRIKKGRRYIALKKGRNEVGLGLFTPQKWEFLISMYPENVRKMLLEKDESLATSEKLEEKAEDARDRTIMTLIEGAVRGEGYLQELKNMIRAQISRTREFTELCYNVGLGVLAAALSKSGINIDEFRKITKDEGPLRDALMTAAETAFKALEYYQSDVIKKLEEERDEARVAYSYVSAQLKSLMKEMEPKLRLERMINNYLLSGNVDPNVLTTLIDKWLAIEITEMRKELIA